MASERAPIPTAVMSFPTRTIAGPGALSRLPEEVRSLKASRVLLVTDPGLEKVGLADRVSEVLDAAKLGVVRYTGVSKNPKEQDVIDGVEAYHDAGASLVVGLGGGAPLDVAKAIRLKVTHPLPLSAYDDLKDGWTRINADQPPMIAIPTTAGTGSEVGRSSVITLPPDGRKVVIFSPHMMPNVALLDAELTVGLPASITAATGIDALTHCLEAYVTPGTHPFADTFALSGLARVGAHLRTAVRDGSNLRARHELLLAASMGAIAFQKGLGACHALAHPLSAICDLHHGLANALMLPHVIRFNLDHATRGYAFAGAALGARSDGDLRTRAEACLSTIEALLADLGLPTKLSACGVEPEHVEPMAAQAVEDACAAGNPRPLGLDDARALYLAAL
jgi:4-hydroxybutyrate dehydrogenase